MKYLSVFSGIEAATVAWHALGWTPVAFAEIEKFPGAVLAHHYPDVPNLGDMRTIAVRILRGEIEAPDVLVGGSPCQAFSVAGNRESLDDDRGNLTLRFVELAAAIDAVRVRDGKPPCVIIWENVPGVLSTHDNAFGCFLAGLAGEDVPLIPAGAAPKRGRPYKWTHAGAVLGPVRTIAWRTLDAQYLGLAQRRKRVFAVASARNGFDPCQVLFEWDGVRRDSAPRRGAAEDTAGTLAGGARRRGGFSYDDIPCAAFGGNNCSGSIDVATARSASASASGRLDFESETFVVAGTLQANAKAAGSATQQDAECGMLVAAPLRAQPNASQRADRDTYIAETLRSRPYAGSNSVGATMVHGTQDPCTSDIAFALGRNNGAENAIAFSCKDHGADAGELSPTLRAMGHSGSHANAGGQVAVAFVQNSRSEVRNVGGDGHIVGALAADHGVQQQNYIFALSGRQRGDDGRGYERPEHFGEIAGTLDATKPDRVAGLSVGVRRLTPRECERLQGFPDDYTKLPKWNGWRKLGTDETPESCAAAGMDVRQNKKTGRWRVRDVDGPRYKALGNSMAVPCMRWVGVRVERQFAGATA